MHEKERIGSWSIFLILAISSQMIKIKLITIKIKRAREMQTPFNNSSVQSVYIHSSLLLISCLRLPTIQQSFQI